MVDFDPAIINKVFETTDPVPVSREKIAKFCETISETNPIFTDDEAAKKGPYGGIVAPPGFATTFRNGRHFFEQVPRFGGRASTLARTWNSSRRFAPAMRLR